MRVFIPALMTALAAGCATPPSAPLDDIHYSETDRERKLVCDAEPVQYHVGYDATQPMGVAILKESGARTLRWGAPDSAWTMDYREDRVNVRYDRSMTITDITCG